MALEEEPWDVARLPEGTIDNVEAVRDALERRICEEEETTRTALLPEELNVGVVIMGADAD